MKKSQGLDNLLVIRVTVCNFQIGTSPKQLHSHRYKINTIIHSCNSFVFFFVHYNFVFSRAWFRISDKLLSIHFCPEIILSCEKLFFDILDHSSEKVNPANKTELETLETKLKFSVSKELEIGSSKLLRKF